MRMETLDGDSMMSSPSSPDKILQISAGLPESDDNLGDRVLTISSGVPDSDENLGGSSLSSLVETSADQSSVSLPPNPIGSPQSAPSSLYNGHNDGVSSSSWEIAKLDDHTFVTSVSKPNESALLEAQDCSTSPKVSSMSSGIKSWHPLRWPSQSVRSTYFPLSHMHEELQKDDSDQPLWLRDNDDELNTSEDCILQNNNPDPPGYVQSRTTDSLWPHPWSPVESRNWFQREAKPTGVGAGLENLGNTCFLNAILQCFTHTVPFVQHLRSYSHDMPGDCTSGRFCVLCALREHVDLALASSGKSISPWKLVDNLTYFSSAFERNQQEDAHEFLQCLLEKLERSLNSKASGEILDSKDDNIVDQVFGGRLVSKLQCCNCGEYSDTYEPMIDLSLEIEDVGTLLSALDSFTRVEKIEDPEAKIKCEKCNEMTSREKQLMLDQAPTVAAFHLKRFKTDGCTVEKIDKHVEFPLELNLNPYTSGHLDNDHVGLKYQLYAVVVHRGYFSTSGHYVCYVRSDLNTWHKLDDSMVYTATEEFVLSQNAYILFYAREGTPWFSKFWESLRPSLDFSSLNTSPKSVLDDVGAERAMHSNSAKLGNSDSDKSTDSAEENLTHFPSRSKQEQEIKDTHDAIDTWFNSEPGLNGPTNSCNECGGDSPMVDASVPPGATDCSEWILSDDDVCSMHSHEENGCTRDLDRGVKSAVLSPSTPLKSRSFNVDHGGSSESNFRVHGHLKVEKQLTNEKPLRKSQKASQKEEEAVRYLRRKGRSTRNLMLIAAVQSRGGPSNKKRLRSSPHRRASPRRKHYRGAN